MTQPKALPSQKELRRRFDYNPQSGELIHRQRKDMTSQWNGRYAGTVAGNLNKIDDRIRVRVNRTGFLAHRVIWKLTYGDIPSSALIDHIDGNPANNRLDNLRLCTASQNQWNRDKVKGKELPKGIYTCKNGYKAEITVNGIREYIGKFKTIDEAEKAHTQAAKILHGPFYRSPQTGGESGSN